VGRGAERPGPPSVRVVLGAHRCLAGSQQADGDARK